MLANRSGISIAKSETGQCLFALAAGCDVELDALTLLQRLVPRAGDVRVVDIHVITVVTGDEPEALVGTENFTIPVVTVSLLSSGSANMVWPAASTLPAYRRCHAPIRSPGSSDAATCSSVTRVATAPSGDVVSAGA